MTLRENDRTQLQKIAKKLEECRSILFITGAGLSADSNLPTYRGLGGLYNDEHTDEGVPIEEALSNTMLGYRPELSWRHISRLEAACRGATFNRGHQVIAAFEKRMDRVCVLTQNVDGFHRAAGSEDVIDIHGDIHQLICTRCAYAEKVTDYSHLCLVPKCPDCNALVRPDVVLFGEMLPHAKLARLYQQNELGFDMVFTIGTSSLFPYIVEPVMSAKALGIPTVEINPGQTDLSRMVKYKIGSCAAEALDYLWSLLEAPVTGEGSA